MHHLNIGFCFVLSVKTFKVVSFALGNRVFRRGRWEIVVFQLEGQAYFSTETFMFTTQVSSVTSRYFPCFSFLNTSIRK